jgi:hypothetical protein
MGQDDRVYCALCWDEFNSLAAKLLQIMEPGNGVTWNDR